MTNEFPIPNDVSGVGCQVSGVGSGNDTHESSIPHLSSFISHQASSGQSHFGSGSAGFGTRHFFARCRDNGADAAAEGNPSRIVSPGGTSGRRNLIANKNFERTINMLVLKFWLGTQSQMTIFFPLSTLKSNRPEHQSIMILISQINLAVSSVH